MSAHAGNQRLTTVGVVSSALLVPKWCGRAGQRAQVGTVSPEMRLYGDVQLLDLHEGALASSRMGTSPDKDQPGARGIQALVAM